MNSDKSPQDEDQSRRKEESQDLSSLPPPYVWREESCEELLRIGIEREQQEQQTQEFEQNAVQISVTEQRTETTPQTITFIDETAPIQWYYEQESDTFLENVVRKGNKPYERTLKLRKK